MILSHPEQANHRHKTLYEHLSQVAERSKQVISSLTLQTELIKPEDLSKLAYTIGLLHDIGKASTYFQAKLLGKAVNNALSHHSLVSAFVAFRYVKSHFKSEFCAPIVFKVIQRHHGNLDVFWTVEDIPYATLCQTFDIYNNISSQIKENTELSSLISEVNLSSISKQDLTRVFGEVASFIPVDSGLDNSIELFLIENLLFSVLIDADKYDAARLNQDEFTEKISLMSYDIKGYLDDKMQNVEKTELNSLRSEFIKEISENQKIVADNQLYSITAPTGIGKTLGCFAFVHKLHGSLQKKRRVVYCLPYTSIIDQNHEVYEHVLKYNMHTWDKDHFKYIIKHHHLEYYEGLSAKMDDYSMQDYLNDKLIIESWNSACIVSTFVQLFHSIIGNRNSMLKKLHHIINSIIVLDEVQNIDPKYYLLIQKFFKVLSQRFDTYIMLCTATQPLIFEANSYIDIIPKDRFAHPVFNRVKVNININRHTLQEFITSKVIPVSFHNCLIVANTKKSAVHLFEELSEIYKEHFKVYCLTTLHLPEHRNRIIKIINARLKAGKKVILISTQLIEAGVDVSFEVVFRDFATMDSIVQVAGRCNRNGELGLLGGTMHLVNLIDENGKEFSNIYDSYLINQTRKIIADYTEIQSSDFPSLLENYFKSLDTDAVSKMLLKAIQELNYSERIVGQIPIQDFKLINDDYATNTVYVLYKEDINQALLEFIELKEAIQQLDMGSDQYGQIRLEIQRIYNKLKQYQLSLSDSELKHYGRGVKHINELDEKTYYIPYEYVQYCYNVRTGFQVTPTESGGCISL
jgi:CRISPR-associated endonuclease/helicase Cas3